MAGLHAMIDESNNVMVRIRKHIADGALDILDVLHTMVLLRALLNSFSILVVALSGEANLTRAEAERRILLEAERQATHSKGVVGNSSGHAKSTGKSFQRNSNHNRDRRNDHPPAVSKDQARSGSRPDFNGQTSQPSFRPVQNTQYKFFSTTKIFPQQQKYSLSVCRKTTAMYIMWALKNFTQIFIV